MGCVGIHSLYADMTEEDHPVDLSSKDDVMNVLLNPDITHDPLNKGTDVTDISGDTPLVTKPGASVSFSELFEFNSGKSIDSFLPDYDRGFATGDETYDGSRSPHRRKDLTPGIGF